MWPKNEVQINYRNCIDFASIVVSLSTKNIYAVSRDLHEVITGTYHFSASEGNNIRCENSFEYYNKCFTMPSFLSCKHLEVLSIQAIEASISYYDDEYETYTKDNSKNIVELLENLKLEDISTNKYYTMGWILYCVDGAFTKVLKQPEKKFFSMLKNILVKR